MRGKTYRSADRYSFHPCHICAKQVIFGSCTTSTSFKAREIKNYIYLGFTSDLRKRIVSHNRGKNKFTKGHIPYELIFYSGFKNKKDAVVCEKYFKTSAGWKRIHNMLRNTLEQSGFSKRVSKNSTRLICEF